MTQVIDSGLRFGDIVEDMGAPEHLHRRFAVYVKPTQMGHRLRPSPGHQVTDCKGEFWQVPGFRLVRVEFTGTPFGVLMADTVSDLSQKCPESTDAAKPGKD